MSSFALVLVLAAAPVQKNDGSPDPLRELIASGDTQALLNRFDVDHDAIRDFYSVRVSERRNERLRAFYERWARALASIDFEPLDRAARVDVLLLQGEISGLNDRLVRDEHRLSQIGELLPFAEALAGLEETRWSVEETDARKLATVVVEITEQVEALTSRVERAEDDGGGWDPSSGEPPPADFDPNAEPDPDGPLPVDPIQAVRAAKAVDSLSRALGDWYRNQAEYEPLFKWWIEDPHRELDEALDAYAKHLREEVAGLKGEDDDPLIGDPIGRGAIKERIAGERIPYGPEELIEIAERELAWCEARAAEVASAMGASDWKDAVERVKAQHVDPGDQGGFVASEARRAIAWLDANDQVTIEPLCRELWRITMLSEETQRVLPFAAYGGQDVLVAYPTAGMDHRTKEMSLRGNNKHFTRIVVPHELIPGHHLQGYMAQRHATHRRAYRTPFYGEGWALYWEMRLWDMDYAGSPEDRVGMLFWRMHRCARVILSLGFHLEQLDPDEMIDYLVDRVGLERHGATSEVRRYVGDSYGPLYQCAYLIGGLQLRALEREVVGGGRMTAREFHDAVLRQNAIPIELVRASLSDEELTRRWRPNWRFASE